MGTIEPPRSLRGAMDLVLPIAHAGHWVQGALYLAPVLILVVVLLWQSRRDDDADGLDGLDAPDVSPSVTP
jgi:hypothetical protein